MLQSGTKSFIRPEMTKEIDLIRVSHSLYHLYEAHAVANPSRIVIEQALIGSSPRSWRALTYEELSLQISKLRGFLQSQGIGSSSRCAICSNTCPEWLIADMAILSLGAATVSVYTTLPTQDIAYIIKDANVTVAIVENQTLVDQFLKIHQGFEGSDEKWHPPHTLSQIICIHPCTPHPLVTSLSDILSCPDIKDTTFECKATRDSLASLVYTSGSTGMPKGVIQTHGNHLANLEQVVQADVFGPSGSLFLYLPLAHSFARLVGYLGLFTDTTLKMPAITDPISGTLDLVSVSQDLRAANCEYIPSIPRLFEKIKMNLERKASEKTLQGWVLRRTLDTAQNMYRATKTKNSVSLITWLIYHITDSIRIKLRQTIFGTNLKHAISGGAKLSPDVAEFFAALDIIILQGYGLTETCVATNVNRHDDNRIGTVGPVFDGIEIKITSEHEICFRGPNVSKGYWGKPEETNASWDNEGWFYTGDLGSVDEDGYLTITGRKKEVIVSAGGKKIAPQKVEKLLESISGISHAVLFGNDRPYCVALLTLSHLDTIKKDNNAQHHPELWKKIEHLNEQLAPFERIRRARIVFEEFSIENGLLTPTHKIKRHEIRDRYQNLIWEMYDNVPHPGSVSPT
jgi:long-chain acyl-CoA synthetase